MGAIRSVEHAAGPDADNPVTVYAIDQGGGKSACLILKDVSPTLKCTHYGEPAVVYEQKNTKE